MSLVAVSIAASSVASAQSRILAAPGDTAARAAARYQDGVDAFQAGRYKDAIDRFNEADAILPSAALSFNTARAYDRLLDSAAALGHYREYLRRDPKSARADEVQQRIAALEAVLAKRGVQQLTLRSDPPGATVVIDDKPVGVTPWMGVVSPGPHVVQMRLPGYYDFSQRFVLARDHAVTFEFRLNPARDTPNESRGTESSDPAAPRETPGVTKSSSTSGSSSAWPWVAFGGSAAAFLTAGGFELARRSAESRAEGDKTQIGYDRAANQAESRRDTARVFAGVGAGLAITGVVLMVALPRTERPQRSGLACGTEGCMARWEGSF